MDIQPLLFRTGLRQAAHDPGQHAELTLHDLLPAVVELQAGAHVEAGTRMTEVKQETTDDN